MILTIVILSLLLYFNRYKRILRIGLPWLLVGYSITGLSLLLWFANSIGIENLKILSGRELPLGWSGKLWALEQGRKYIKTD